MTNGISPLKCGGLLMNLTFAVCRIEANLLCIVLHCCDLKGPV